MALLALNVFLTLVWGAVTGDFGTINLLFGFVLGALALYVPRPFWGESKYFRRVALVASLAWLFIVELVLSSFRVARDILRPGMNFQSGIIALPLKVDRDPEITLLANLITLTPGTLSLDVSNDKSVIYVHAMDVADADILRSEIKDGFETQILETFR
ncbi:MAG: Na+/H+ antiporter subunit E [Pseudomonadota bacterium]